MFRMAATISSLVLFAATATAQIFREVPSSESGITWTHQNGRSEHRYLPETTGAGVAIFDYNNDGWMDILLVNSGASSFYKPPPRCFRHFIATITTERSPKWQKKPG